MVLWSAVVSYLLSHLPNAEGPSLVSLLAAPLTLPLLSCLLVLPLGVRFLLYEAYCWTLCCAPSVLSGFLKNTYGFGFTRYTAHDIEVSATFRLVLCLSSSGLVSL